jgi:transposase
MILLEQFPFDVNRNEPWGFPRTRKSDSSAFVGGGGGMMAKGYSNDLRARVVGLVEAGESRREAARLLDIGASTAIRWFERWTSTGSVAARPGTGHSRSPLEAHRQWLLDLVVAEPDLTLDEIRARLAGEKKLKTGRSSVGRFYERHDITFKKNSARCRAGST